LLQLFCLPHWLSCLWQVIARPNKAVVPELAQVAVLAAAPVVVQPVVVQPVVLLVVVLQQVVLQLVALLLLLAQRRLQLQPR
jgi:hypothetical protein